MRLTPIVVRSRRIEYVADGGGGCGDDDDEECSDDSGDDGDGDEDGDASAVDDDGADDGDAAAVDGENADERAVAPAPCTSVRWTRARVAHGGPRCVRDSRCNNVAGERIGQID